LKVGLEEKGLKVHSDKTLMGTLVHTRNKVGMQVTQNKKLSYR